MLVMTESRRTTDIAGWIGDATGYDVTTVHDARNARALLEARVWRGVVAEAWLRDGGGEALIEQTQEVCPDAKTMLLATDRSQGEAADAVVPAWATRAELMEAMLTTLGDPGYVPPRVRTISTARENLLSEPAVW